MINGFAHLFVQTKENIAKIRGVKTSGFVDSTEVACVNNRAAQICALDLLLAEHRKKYGTRFNCLNGKQALYHKLLIKYQWPLSLIRELKLEDALLALHDELAFESFGEDACKYLQRVTLSQYPVNFPDYLETEWDPMLSEKFLFDSQDQPY